MKKRLEKKWIAVIALGVVVLLLVGLLIWFIVGRQQEVSKFYLQPKSNGEAGYDVIEIKGPDATTPPDAIVGYFENNEYHEVQSDTVLPADAEPVFSNPESHPDSPTAPPTTAPRKTGTSTTPKASDTDAPVTIAPSTPAPTDEPGGELGIPTDDWSTDGAIVVDFEDLFGTSTP